MKDYYHIYSPQLPKLVRQIRGLSSTQVVAIFTGLLLSALCVVPSFYDAHASHTCNRHASDASTLSTQFGAAAAGETICLATGSYGTWTGGNKAVTIAADDGATPTMDLSFNTGAAQFTLDGLTITHGHLLNGANNITIKNSTFTGIFMIDGVYNGNILFDNNTHIDIDYSVGSPAGRISFPYGNGSTHSGVTIQNSLFRGGSSDGIQTGVGVNIYNNEFDSIREYGDPDAHTDSIQLLGGHGSVIRGNFIHDGSTGIVAYDGVGDVLIEHNVVGTNGRPEAIELYSDTDSIVRHNTVIGSIYLDNKPADPPGSGTIVKDNIATTVSEVNGSTVAEQTNNLLQSGAQPGDIIGTPTYIGGASPSTYAGYELAPGSNGINAASDGENIGVVFSDTTAPSVSLTAPTDGATVSGTISLTSTASDNVAVAGVTFRYGSTIIGSEDTDSPYTVNWDTTTVSNGTYNLTATARDTSNNTSVSTVITITVNNPALSIARSIWDDSVTPSAADSGDSDAIEVGVKFRSEIPGEITGIRFYKSTNNTGTHVGTLWSSGGTALATVTFTDETASGWQEALFSAPVTINADTTYVVSYHAPNGHYSADGAFFSTEGVNNYPLSALANGEHGNNGVYLYGNGGVMPTNSFNATNYWVDVVFTTEDTIPPAVNMTAPTSGSTVNGIVSLGANASDNEVIQSVQFQYGCPGSCTNIGIADTSSPYNLNWDTTLVPDGSCTVTARAVDASGNATTSTGVTVTVDNTPPETIIDNTSAEGNSAIIEFSSNDGNAVFECRVNTDPYTSCVSPLTLGNLVVGQHTFMVRAVDLVGNIDQTPAQFTWEVSGDPEDPDDTTKPTPKPKPKLTRLISTLVNSVARDAAIYVAAPDDDITTEDKNTDNSPFAVNQPVTVDSSDTISNPTLSPTEDSRGWLGLPGWATIPVVGIALTGSTAGLYVLIRRFV